MLDPVINVAIYIIWWWISFFAMLPIGVRSAQEEGASGPGHDSGAPAVPNLRKKALWAAIAALVLWALTAAIIFFDPLHIRPEFHA